MISIESTQDVFYVTASGVILVVGIFLAWTLYYLCMSLRDTRKITRDIRERVEAFWEVIELLRDKLQVGSAVFKIAATGIKELAEHFKGFTEDEKPKRKKKKEEDEE
ncbi:MAG: hypothetical protein COV79_04265 [Parcubacteria group bacterium CG11_big_fil_rev_8_21_14_0_20_41_14]|nr:MAG: hypothetical protein COV79_04265 [Parcubacteria group bacterium CG11_big_fil_rev_8_21_14_0_20_41_14]